MRCNRDILIARFLKMRTIFICGLSRSGSTFLQFLLTRHSEVVSLGEIDHVIRRRGEMGPSEKADGLTGLCTCGHSPAACQFWGELIGQLQRKDESDLNLHNAILQRFSEMYTGHAMLDCSKDYRVLAKYYRKPDRAADLKVLLIVRDFRGWILSTLKHAKNRRRRELLVNTYMGAAYFWLIKTIQTRRYLERNNIPYICVCYENLVFQTEGELHKIHRFLGLSDPSTRSAPQHSNTAAHEMYGSPTARAKFLEQNQISYDTSWFSDLRSVYAAPLLAPVYAYNRAIQRQPAMKDPL